MKKRKVNALLAIVLSLTMLVGVTGCGKEQQLEAEINPDTPATEVQFPLKETAELSFITSAPATSTQEPNERVIFQRMEEQTNVHIDWTCFVSDQFSDKKNLALAQFGNLPDGLFNAGMSDYDLLRYAKQGIIIPLENLIDKYMPNLQAVFEKYPEYRTMCTAPDGHIYSFPWIEQLGAGKEAIQAIGDIPYINKKWLDYLGLEIPTTTDELEQVLIQFRDHADELEKEFNPDTPATEVQFPLKETAELSFITSAPATSTQEPNERVIFQRMEEQTNVHIDWTCFVSDQFSDKKNLALAQFGNLPDGLFNAGMSDYDLLRYAKQGIIIPLENLIDKYMPNLQAVFEKYPEYRTMCTAPDGHIYSFPWIEQLGAGKEAIQAIGDIPYINKKWLDYLGLEIPTTTDELEQVLIQFRDHADELEKEFSIEGDVIPMSFIINNGDQDPAILMNGFGEGYGDTGDHFAVTDEGKVIYTTVQEGYKEGIEWLHKLVTEDLVDPEAFTQEWSTYVAKGKNHRYGLCFTWDIANIDNNEDYVMLPALTGPNGMRNITRQNNSETSGFDRGRCVLTSSCRNTALAAAWIDQMYAPLQSPQNNWGTYGEKDSFNIFELSTNKDGGEMLKHMDLGTQSPVEVREAQSVNGPLAVLNEYYDVYVTQPEDAKWRLDNMHETYLQDMNSKYVYPNVFMSIDDTNKVSQYDTDIKKYAEQKKADWILNGGIEKEWDSYLKKMEQYGLSDYLSIKQKYFDEYQKSLSEEK